ncbi:MAG: hypothetical protein KC550_02185 [Nanoarchaeota archaeon]|nr:hypothetical protein [Nanoarchaeota archaeon]
MKIKHFYIPILPTLSLLLVLLLWKYPLYLNLCLLLLIITLFYINKLNKKTIFFCIITGIGGAIFEATCVYLGIWFYTKPLFLIPFWLILIWIITCIFVLNLNSSIKTLISIICKKKSNFSPTIYKNYEYNNIEITILMLLVLITILSIFLFWKNNIILFFILILLASIFIYITKNRYIIYSFVFTSIAGFTAETISVHFGVWTYTNPTFLVPIWMLPGWGWAYLSIITINFFYFNLIQKYNY